MHTNESSNTGPLFSRILLYTAAAGFLLSAAVHAAAISGVEAGGFAVSPFVLHLFALVCFGAAFIQNSLRMREMPPRLRVHAFLTVLRQRPSWLLASVVILILYSSANLFLFVASSTLRGFSGVWMLFFAAAFFFAFPAAPFPEEPPLPQALPDSFHVPYSSLWSRMMQGPVKFMYIWLAFLSAGFAALGFFAPGFLFLCLLFLVVLVLNLLLRMRSTRTLISSAVVTGEFFSGELYRYNTKERFQLPLSDLKVELMEESIRGNSIFSLKLSDLKGRELIRQYHSNEWHYDLLRQLHDRLAAATAQKKTPA